jgi:DNA-binding transcriptional MocR family regulator
MPAEERNAVVAVARRHDLLVIEDGAYGFLEEDPPPSFVELAPERTVHVGGFSKNIATGLRIGYLLVPAQLAERISIAIRATTWNVPALISALTCQWIADGTVTRLEVERRRMGADRQKLCRAVLGEQEIISHPNTTFAWLPLSKAQRAEPLVVKLSIAGIAVTSAQPYSITDAVPQALRIAFGNISPTDLQNSLEIIREILERS